MEIINHLVRMDKDKLDATYPVEWRYANDCKSAYRSSDIYMHKKRRNVHVWGQFLFQHVKLSDFFLKIGYIKKNKIHLQRTKKIIN